MALILKSWEAVTAMSLQHVKLLYVKLDVWLPAQHCITEGKPSGQVGKGEGKREGSLYLETGGKT